MDNEYFNQAAILDQDSGAEILTDQGARAVAHITMKDLTFFSSRFLHSSCCTFVIIDNMQRTYQLCKLCTCALSFFPARTSPTFFLDFSPYFMCTHIAKCMQT